jgi:hypothetical protein
MARLAVLESNVLKIHANAMKERKNFGFFNG